MCYKTAKKTSGVSIERIESSVFIVSYFIIVGFSLLFSNYSTYAFQYSF